MGERPCVRLRDVGKSQRRAVSPARGASLRKGDATANPRRERVDRQAGQGRACPNPAGPLRLSGAAIVFSRSGRRLRWSGDDSSRDPADSGHTLADRFGGLRGCCFFHPLVQIPSIPFIQSIRLTLGR
jgi:hypothetical protein